MAHFTVHRCGEAIESLRPIERESANSVGDRKKYELIRHVCELVLERYFSS